MIEQCTYEGTPKSWQMVESALHERDRLRALNAELLVALTNILVALQNRDYGNKSVGDYQTVVEGWDIVNKAEQS